jgi:hypothetical protein
LDGPAKNRKLWDRINVQNPSQECTRIGLSQLSALGIACGITFVQSEDQFLGKLCYARVKVKGENNEIHTYSSPESTGGPGQPQPASRVQPAYQPPAVPPPQYQQPSQATASAPPWAR